MNGESAIQEAYEAILGNHFERAISCFEQAIALEPHNASYYYKLSVTCARSGRLDKALVAASRAADLEPDNLAYRQQVGNIRSLELLVEAKKSLQGKGENGAAEAVTKLRRAILLDPLSTEAYLLLGLAYGEQQDYSAAIRTLRELLKLEPHHKEGRALLIKYQRKRRK